MRKTWEEWYSLAKTYFEHHGHLNIPQSFKTINGYEYDENGFWLGLWVYNQKRAYNGKIGGNYSQMKVQKLLEIGMCFDIKNREEEWNKNYALAKIYFEHHGHLNIPQTFKTTNGYEYDDLGTKLGIWIHDQRQAYKGLGTAAVMPEEHLFLLEEIEIVWFSKNIDKKFQQESISVENIIRKKREILNRFLSSLLTMRKNMFTEKEDIKELNESFLRCLK